MTDRRPQRAGIHARPAELLQHLIRFDTTNPPGNEAECISYLEGLIDGAGVDARIIAKDPQRPNLIARLAGRGDAPPLLLQGHVDVVTTQDQDWTHPPFDGLLEDGYVWGRGALDMKAGVAMMVSAFLRAAVEDTALPGDVILCVLSDEEAGGDLGARFLVEEHPQLFDGVRFAIGEFGGFAFEVGGQRFYPIMVGEKQICWLKGVLRGPGGHASRPPRGGAMAQLAQVLARLDARRLPTHITPIPRQMIETMASHLPFARASALRLLLQPATTDRVLDGLGERAQVFAPLLHNTATPTIVRAGRKINVVPSRVELELDGRLLPGFAPDDLIDEVRTLVDVPIELEVVRHDPGPPEPDMALFDTLADILRRQDPDGVPVPLLLSGATDGRHFAQLGIQTYGFLPMNLPPELKFTQLVHAADERIPAACVEFGAEAVFRALQRFGEVGDRGH